MITVTTLSKTRSRFAVLVFFILIVAVSYLFIYPEVLSLRTQTLEVESNSLDVRGVYWELPLASVDSLTLSSNRLIVEGKYAPLVGSFGMRGISRTIPSELVVSTMFRDSLRLWGQSDAFHIIIGKDIIDRTIMNLRTGQRFSFRIPFIDYYEILHFYNGLGDTSIATFAFGKKGQDQQSLMGYILITKRVAK